ncbi:MAG TPA: hypothetical protein VN428_11690 [Bryobacteraceae bacterium]|nr:hypothetical protein [Bryobacteraceae bacterium]
MSTAFVRYLGFEQQSEQRAYEFDRVSSGEERATFVFTMDLSLLRRCQVKVQDGPGLCLSLLKAGLETSDRSGWGALSRTVNEEDLRSYVARRAAIALARKTGSTRLH